MTEVSELPFWWQQERGERAWLIQVKRGVCIQEREIIATDEEIKEKIKSLSDQGIVSFCDFPDATLTIIDTSTEDSIKKIGESNA